MGINPTSKITTEAFTQQPELATKKVSNSSPINEVARVTLKEAPVAANKSLCDRFCIWIKEIFDKIFCCFQSAKKENLKIVEQPDLPILNLPVVVRAPIEISLENREKIEKGIANFANELSLKIYEKNPNKSFSISPVSIVAVLGMILHAVQPDMKEQFLEKLGLKGMSEVEAQDIIASTLQRLSLPEDFKKGVLEMAQALITKDKNSVSPSFLDLLKNNYGADCIEAANLKDVANKWVKTRTQGKIDKILEQDSSMLTHVLLNAVYLAFEWQKKFKKPDEGWSKEDFTCVDGSIEKVSMMEQKNDFQIFEHEEFKMLEMPYVSPEGRKLSQLIFLPHDEKNLASIEKTLNAETIQDYRKKCSLEEVRVQLPKTKTSFELKLTPILKELGISLAVDPAKLGKAELPPQLIHKTFVSTNEEGSEAAAVTGEMICTFNPFEIRKEPKEFIVNHSFAYFIMDNDVVLFRGRVTDKEPLILDL